MWGFFERLDELGGIDRDGGIAAWLDRAAFVFLVLMILAAPHSIAATQTAWITGMFLWLVGLVIKKYSGPSIREDRGHTAPRARKKVLDALLWALFGWSVVTSLTSYAADISIDKLRGVAVFLIFYFVFYNLRNLAAVKFAAFALIVSCMVNVVWTPIQRLIGRGVEVHGLAGAGPLAKALLIDGDTLLDANGKKLQTPEDVVSTIEKNESTKINFYRPDFEFTVDVPRGDLLPGETSLERLGITGWNKSHNWRSSGFYGHYTTYSEMLQLIMALVLGLLVAGLLSGGNSNFNPPRRRDAEEARAEEHIPKLSFFSLCLRVSAVNLLLFVSLALMCLALLLTVTRASQLGFLVAAFVIVAAAGSKKLFLWLAAVAVPVAIAGLLFLQASRNVGFLDVKDDSTIYRETMWRDGMRIWTESPRNLVVGVGMDSIQRYWREWGMFDGGRLPMGHFHSTPVQLLVERGFPALLLWLGILAAYGWISLSGLISTRHDSQNSSHDGPEPGTSPQAELWVVRGILLGSLGSIAGFFTSGLVHYNLGDQEVAMMFFLLMGLGVKTATLLEPSAPERIAVEAAFKQRLAA